MKKIVLALLCFVSTYGVAQKKLSELIPGSLYTSVDDFKSKKSVAGYSIMPVTWKYGLGGKESIEVNNNGKKDRMKIAELPATFLTEVAVEDGGVLMRAFNNELYYIIVSGPICYYVKKADCEVYELHGPSVYSKQFTTGKYFSTRTDGIEDYYSEGITGEIKKLKSKDFEKMLEAKGLKDKYRADEPKREKKDNVGDYISKVKWWTAKYIAML